MGKVIYTGNPVIDAQHAPKPRVLGSAFHIIMFFVGLFTLGLGWLLWAVIGTLHYCFAYLPAVRKQEVWKEEDAAWGQAAQQAEGHGPDTQEIHYV